MIRQLLAKAHQELNWISFINTNRLRWMDPSPDSWAIPTFWTSFSRIIMQPNSIKSSTLAMTTSLLFKKMMLQMAQAIRISANTINWCSPIQISLSQWSVEKTHSRRRTLLEMHSLRSTQLSSKSFKACPHLHKSCCLLQFIRLRAWLLRRTSHSSSISFTDKITISH